MTNRMADLRREVASRLRESLHGKEIDMMEGVRPRLPHMLGITPLDEVHDAMDEEGTLLDASHEFWDDYEEDVRTNSRARDKIQTAVRTLREEDVFRMTYPYGREAEIVYVEVDDITGSGNELQTSCKECGTVLRTRPDLDEYNGSYCIRFLLDCPDCEFSEVVAASLCRQ